MYSSEDNPFPNCSIRLKPAILELLNHVTWYFSPLFMFLQIFFYCVRLGKMLLHNMLKDGIGLLQ